MCEGIFDCEFLLQIDLHVVFAFPDLIIPKSPFLSDALVGGVEVEHGGYLFGNVKATEKVEEQGSFEEGRILL